LFFARDVQPELNHHSSEIVQLAFEGVDLFEGALPLDLFGETFHALY
jgi:hypothetical protein